MDRRKFIKELIVSFADKTGCGIQHGGCPCNTCFHSIDANFNHICWLIVLGLRGDYKDSHEEIIKDIRDELKLKSLANG